MEGTNKVDIEAYIDLYNKGMTLDMIKEPKLPSNKQTYRIFKESRTPVRVIDRTLTYQNPMAFTKIKHFVAFNKFFYMVPVRTIRNTIVGFILRGVTHSDYSTISRTFSDPQKQVPLMFGFDSSFSTYDSKERLYPIIVCEGCKDCLALKKFYPYVLANNTSSMGMNSTILRGISDKFILAYDNDSAGKEGMEKDRKILRSTGAFVEVLKIKDGFKDCADVSENSEEFEKLKDQIKVKLRHLFKVCQV